LPPEIGGTATWNKQGWDEVFGRADMKASVEKKNPWGKGHMKEILKRRKSDRKQQSLAFLVSNLEPKVKEESTNQRTLWTGWRRPYLWSSNNRLGRHVHNRDNNFNVGWVPKQREGELRFHIFIMYNPSSEMAQPGNLEQMFAIWDSWERPNIQVHVAVPIDASKGMKVPAGTKVKVMVVDEKEDYPPVKLVLASWKKMHTSLKDSFTPKTFVMKVRDDNNRHS
jgi:hypothetical protein